MSKQYNKQRELYMDRILLAFFIATFIFINAFLISYGVSYSKSRKIAQNQEEIYYGILNIQLENYFASTSCESFNPYEFSEELDSMGSLLGILEERFGKHDEKVIKQKRIYSLIELQHSILINNHNLKCNETFLILLFFYSNEENFKVQAEKVGYILESYKNKNNLAMIYSFDYDLDLEIIQLLKEKYNMTQPNTVILFKEGTKIENLQKIDDLEQYFE